MRRGFITHNLHPLAAMPFGPHRAHRVFITTRINPGTEKTVVDYRRPAEALADSNPYRVEEEHRKALLAGPLMPSFVFQQQPNNSSNLQTQNWDSRSTDGHAR